MIKTKRPNRQLNRVSIKITTSYCNHSGRKINYKHTSQEGGFILRTNLDQSQPSIQYYVCSPREGSVNLCTDSDQSQSRSSIHYHERSPREGAVNLCTDFNQLEPRKLLKVHPPREGSDNL